MFSYRSVYPTFPKAGLSNSWPTGQMCHTLTMPMPSLLRQAALKHLLSTEHLQYQLEFNHLGMSFYAERL
uniref:Uncharacterized protein n=1 Tax=Naja naja TaxID=35670 RepID=A0A8C6VLH1_NAJNA